VLVVAAGMCWALANITTRKMGTVSALSLVVWGSFIATPPLFAASLLLEGVGAWRHAAASFSLATLGAVLFNAYPNTILGFGVWSMLIRRYAAATVAPFTLLVPVAGMASAALVLGEPLQWWKIVAGLLVLSGLALNLFGPRILGRLRAAP
jgi:O-acetylserine/cysteine efflux transporter